MKYTIYLLCCFFIMSDLSAQGSPDSDKDGVPDNEDVCPFTAGSKANKGCPDENKKITTPAKVTVQPVAIKGAQEELNQLNKYLETFAGGSYGVFSIEKDSVYNRLKDGNYWYRFSVKDIYGAEVHADNKCVSIMCGESKIHCIMASYGSNDGGVMLNAYFNSYRRPYNYAVLANLMNRFFFALKKQPIPAALVYPENIYTKTTTPEEDAVANASNPLEKAVAEFNMFLKNMPYGQDYFKGAELNGSILRINKLVGSNTNINLDRVGAIRISNVDAYKPIVSILSNSTGYCISTGDGYYSEKEQYNELDSASAKKFYLMAGTILDAYRARKDSKYKSEKTYAGKLEAINRPDFMEKIESGATVRIDDVMNDGKDYRKIIKWKGAEVTVLKELNINEDFETYSGTIRTGTGTNFTVKRLKLTFIKDKDGNDAIALRKITSDYLRDKAQQKTDAETELTTQWYPVTKILRQFREDAAKPGGLLKYKSESAYTLEQNEGTIYFLDKYKIAKHIVSVFLEVSKEGGKCALFIRFNKSFAEHYLDYITYQVPVKPSRNPDNLTIEERKDEVTGFRNIYLYANNVNILTVIERDNNKDETGLIIIYQN